MRLLAAALLTLAAPTFAQLESFPGIADPSSESKPRVTFTLPTVPINPPPTITRTLTSPITSVTGSSTLTAPVTESTSSTSLPGSSSTTSDPDPVATQPPPNAALALAPAGSWLFFAVAPILACI